VATFNKNFNEIYKELMNLEKKKPDTSRMAEQFKLLQKDIQSVKFSVDDVNATIDQTD